MTFVATNAPAIERWLRTPSESEFENNIELALLTAGRRALNDRSPDTIAAFFEMFARVGPIADHAIGEIALDLVESEAEHIAAASKIMSLGGRAELEATFEQWPTSSTGSSISHEQIEAEQSHQEINLDETHGLPRTATAARFLAEARRTGPRGFPIFRGTLTLESSNGGSSGDWRVNTGGSASSHKMRGGPLPPGTYRISNFRRRSDKQAMIRDGIGFSLDLDPLPGTAVFGRSLFRIHPDGNVRGTLGCLGIDEDRPEIESAMRAFERAVANGPSHISVDYGALG